MAVYPVLKNGAHARTDDGQLRFLVKVWDPQEKKPIARRVSGEANARRIDADLQALVLLPVEGRVTVEPVGRGKATFAASPLDANTITVRDWADVYLERFQTRSDGTPRSRASWDHDANALNIYILPKIGDRSLASITPWELDDLVRDLTLVRSPGKPASGHTKESVAGTLKRVLKMAKQRGVLTGDNPAADLPSSWGGKSEDRAAIIPDLDDVDKLAAAMEAELKGFGDVIYLIAYTGLRWEEFSVLTLEHVWWEKACIKVERSAASGTGQLLGITKTVAGNREVPIIPQLHPVLQNLIARGERIRAGRANFAGDRFLIPNKFGGQLHYSTWRKAIDAARKTSGVDLTAHELRHVAASIFIHAKLLDTEVARIMGHSNVTFTRKVYGHLFPTDHNPTAQLLGDTLDALRKVKTDERRQGLSIA